MMMTNKEKSKIQKEIVDSLPLKPHGRLLLAPRVGKSKLVIDIIKKNNPKSILWVTPSAQLAEKDIPEEFEIWKGKRFISKLTTVTWMSLNKIKGHYEMIVLDEEQFATENNTINLVNKELTADYIISMTGTQTKHEDKKDLYKALNLPILYKLSINEAVNIGILANYTIKVIEIDMGVSKNIPAGTKDKPFMTTEVAQYNYLDSTAKKAMFQKRKDIMFRILARMRAIYDSPTKTEVAKYFMDNLKGRKLFFCASQKQAEYVSKYFYHSKTNDNDVQRFIKGEIDDIAMVNAGGIGWTYKEIDHLFMVQADSDKNGLTSQKIARTLLDQPNYKATIWVLCLIGTQDEKWVESALENFDKTKVEYIRYKNIKENKDFSSFNSNLDVFKENGVEEIQMGNTTYKL
jgi:superfamily II DNA or RNA helicase